jgi:hypothetical protein
LTKAKPAPILISFFRKFEDLSAKDVFRDRVFHNTAHIVIAHIVLIIEKVFREFDISCIPFTTVPMRVFYIEERITKLKDKEVGSFELRSFIVIQD